MTVVAGADAAGGTTPPIITFKGKNRRENFGNSLSLLACFEMAEKGRTTN